MRAVVYEGPFSVSVKEVLKPVITHPDDVIVKVTTTCICGRQDILTSPVLTDRGFVDSDLHMYEGRTAAQAGIVFGHENYPDFPPPVSTLKLLKKGDRVVMPFNVACGRCLNCEEGRSAFCTIVNPGFCCWISTIGFIRYVAMGPYQGGQAEYVKVPFADYNALKLPPGTEHEEDFALLADIFPTGWHGVELSVRVSPPDHSTQHTNILFQGFRSGESVAVFGAGPVGLMAAYSAILRGASEVREVDRGVDAVGYQATTGDGKTEKPNVVLEALINVVRPTGGLGIPGLYVPSDPGAPDSAAAKGYISFPFGKLFEKGLRIGTGQCNVKAYNRYLRDLIISGKAKPSFVVSHNLSLDDATIAYEKFDKRVDGYTKVLLHP
ncbi:hypothetical protein JVT61DRAFT_15245 [Boletus reticuloceps]|uniref:Alcohol dehydrogenase-like N-terminal domain-containing protein n=1 Tax=Boletus reticuloceps TaxID=495285 RepID=A0A8I2YS54_9AGAM|nr:hypothetical protein JVT61DRAFT_15245 [Boletus reticuloceps]